MENILTGIYICLIVQIGIVGIANLFQKEKRNKILGVFCFLLIFSLVKRIFGGSIEGTGLYCIFGGPHEILYAPILYTYLLVSKSDFNKNYLKHIVFAFSIYLVLHFSAMLFFKNHRSTIAPFFLLSIMIFSVLYFLKGIRLYKYHLKEKLKRYPRIRFHFFYISANVFILLKAFVISIAFFNSIVNNSISEDLYHNFSLPVFYYVVVPLFLILCLVYIFYGLTEINWLKKSFLNIEIRKKERQITTDYKEILNLFDNEHIYIDPDINLNNFTNNFNLNISIVYQFLKDHGYSNFQDIINHYRVKDFKKRIDDSEFENYDLVGIAKKSGFKSKSTFYRVFRKYENVTPNEYVNNSK